MGDLPGSQVVKILLFYCMAGGFALGREVKSHMPQGTAKKIKEMGYLFSEKDNEGSLLLLSYHS